MFQFYVQSFAFHLSHIHCHVIYDLSENGNGIDHSSPSNGHAEQGEQRKFSSLSHSLFHFRAMNYFAVYFT